MDSKTNQISDELSELFGEYVDVEMAESSVLDGIELVQCIMSIDHSTASQRAPMMRQSAVVLIANDLDLPAFGLAPTGNSIAQALFDRLGGVGTISFPNSAAFSEHYRVHGWVEEAIRILFDAEVRAYFETELGWTIRGKGDRMVLFRKNEVVTGSEKEDFVASALGVLEVLQAAESRLDLRPDVHRETTVADVMASTGQTGGIFGSYLQRQIRKIAVSPSELTAFLNSEIPRAVPPGAKRQMLGDTLYLGILGLAFLFLGGGMGLGAALSAEEEARIIGMVFMIIFPLIGGLISFFTFRFRFSKWRILRRGRLVEGAITDLKRTQTSVNNQLRYHVHVSFTGETGEVSTTLNAYSVAVTKAREILEAKGSVQLLIDPRNEQKVICPDLWIMLEKNG